MSLSQTSLEDAYGGKPFGTRAKVQEHFAEQDENEKKKKAVVESVLASLPLETPIPSPAEKRMEVRERFSERGADEDKISRILRLIEQNRTGYERPAVQDMILYVFTGVFFLFTFDTFVMMGKGMRKKA